jgi:TolB protein
MRTAKIPRRAAGALGLLFAGSCFLGPKVPSLGDLREGLQGRYRTYVEQSFAELRWDDALSTCQAIEEAKPSDCGARYCDLLAQSMGVVDRLNDFIRLTPHANIFDWVKLGLELPKMDKDLARATQAADAVIAQGCEYDLPSLPLRVGVIQDPLLQGDVRGRWTVRDAHLLAALFESMQHVLEAVTASASKKESVLPTPPGQQAPALPPLLAAMKQHLIAHDALLFSQPADPAALRGGWLDRNGNHEPDAADELLVDIFVPGTNKRIFDFSHAEFVRGQALPETPLTATADLPRARCDYHKFHFDDLTTDSEMSRTDGMSFSPDGTKVALSIMVGGHYHVHTFQPPHESKTCVTCGQPGDNDGVRWRPVSGDALLFVSSRDHGFALGDDAAGFGQELYAMRPNGTQVTRLTSSHAWATNYHPNWSQDGKRIVWGRTEDHAWDVMIADFVSDGIGMHLESPRRLVHDSTWWETHGFSADGKSVIATNTRAGFLSTDIYAIDIESGRLRRLTSSPAWDEHAHLSPDGRKLAWISGRWQPAATIALNDGSISPVFDFLWIMPGILFQFLPPAGYRTELTLMDADGTHVERLTTDGLVVADNEWSADGRRIIFRQTNPATTKTKIRSLTFDDCR